MFLSAIPGALTNVDSTLMVKQGSRYVDESGNEYIYCAGAASVAAGTVCALELDASDLPIVERLTETIGAKGVSVCVALAAVVANKYGWFQVAGTAEASCLISDAADATQHCTTTAGSIDDAGTTHIHGLRLVDTEPGSATANLTVVLNHPHTGV